MKQQNQGNVGFSPAVTAESEHDETLQKKPISESKNWESGETLNLKPQAERWTPTDFYETLSQVLSWVNPFLRRSILGVAQCNSAQ